MIKSLVLAVALLVSATVYAEGGNTSKKEVEPMTDSGLPRKVENVTIKDLYGNPATLPYYGEKNLPTN